MYWMVIWTAKMEFVQLILTIRSKNLGCSMLSRHPVEVLQLNTKIQLHQQSIFFLEHHQQSNSNV
jgi:hypothetical protein